MGLSRIVAGRPLFARFDMLPECRRLQGGERCQIESELLCQPTVLSNGSMRDGGFMRRFSPGYRLLVVGVAMLVSLGFLSGPRAQGARDAGPAPQAQTPAGPPGAASDVQPQPSVTILGSRQAQSVLGREVRSSADENMGRIVDVIVDHDGRVRAAVIDFGGFLGVGSRKIAVDWNALSFPAPAAARDVVTLELTRDQVKAAPEYKDKQTVIVLGAAGALQPLPNE
jgi:hypothetical protein